jgi:hypothetical protein
MTGLGWAPNVGFIMTRLGVAQKLDSAWLDWVVLKKLVQHAGLVYATNIGFSMLVLHKLCPQCKFHRGLNKSVFNSAWMDVAVPQNVVC